MSQCRNCDYNRSILTYEECKKIWKPGEVLMSKIMRDATVCVNPSSPYAGKHRRPNSVCRYHAYSAAVDDVITRNMILARLVSKYRHELYELPQIDAEGVKNTDPYYV